MLGAIAAVLVQAGAPAQVAPVLGFPEPSLDDTSAYQGYQTRFYRDARGNPVQIYLAPESGRVVHLLANGANESIGFTARDTSGRPVRMSWEGDSAAVVDAGGSRSLSYRLASGTSAIELGWFVLGSMRIERDFQYAGRQREPFGAPPFVVAEESLLVAGVGRVPAEERGRHLELLRARNLGQLRARLQPIITVWRESGDTRARVERSSLDGRNRLVLELRAGPGVSLRRPTPRTLAFEADDGGSVQLGVTVVTDAPALTPLRREEIFNRAFLTFLEGEAAATDSAGLQRYRRLDRQVRGVELLSTREKLMAGLPNFATYFGRDMMMTALMMRPIWTPTMPELVIASVLRKLGPGGMVSHEEALGGQAIREHAVVYDSLLRRGAFAEARATLADLQATRENYHMIDDEYQLPVLAASYLADSTLSRERKLAFLSDTAGDGESNLVRLLRELSLVSAQTRPYVEDPRPGNLVSFPRRDATHWRSASWRDSDAGYAGGRYAMDVNAIWAPEALEGIADILAILPALGVPEPTLDSALAGRESAVLRQYVSDGEALRQAIATWRGARRHFLVTLRPAEALRRVAAKLASLPAAEREHWSGVLERETAETDSVTFLAVSLDAQGRPIPVETTDPATGLFLGTAAEADLEPFMRSYPVGLFVDGLGPLATNDAYASSAVWERFRKDPYHGPRVVWGREVNLLQLGLARRAKDERDPRAEEALRRVVAAVHASGLEHNELWSYRIEGGRLLPTRYGTSSDIQLWTGTHLAVQYELSR